MCTRLIDRLDLLHELNSKEARFKSKEAKSKSNDARSKSKVSLSGINKIMFPPSNPSLSNKLKGKKGSKLVIHESMSSKSLIHTISCAKKSLKNQKESSQLALSLFLIQINKIKTLNLISYN